MNFMNAHLLGVMAGPVAAIHILPAACNDAGGRGKLGHDGGAIEEHQL
jgi:hypothetical protein